MAEDPAPLVALDASDAGNAPRLSYNVPDPTSYAGRNYIDLDFGADDPFAPRGDGPDPAPVGLARPVVVNGLMAMRPRDGVDGFPTQPVPHDPPQPRASLVIVAPGEGATMESGAGGTTVTVTVDVTFRWASVSMRPSTVSVLVDGAETAIPMTPGPAGGAVRYEGPVHLAAGANQLRASVSLRTVDAPSTFVTPAPRVVTLIVPPSPPAPDVTPPTLSVTAPLEGAVWSTADGTSPITVTGSVADAESAAAPTVTVRIGDGAAVDAGIAHDGVFTATVQATAPGPATVQATAPGPAVVTVTALNSAGLHSTIQRSVSVESTVQVRRHRLMIVECLRLSNFLGRYGAGRIVQTFSLLPGEKNAITIRAFTSTQESRNATSSIFDSFSDTTSTGFESAVSAEDTTASKSQEDLKASVNVKAGATWGFGSASVEAGLAYGTASAREELSKNVVNATSKHAAERSSKRDVKVDTTQTVTSQTQNEQTIVRTLENTNLSRTLNFVFRQMTQEFVSLLHLVDIRIGHMVEWLQPDGTTPVTVDGTGAREGRPVPKVDYEEVTLSQLTTLLAEICAGAESAARAEFVIRSQLDAVFDHRGEHVDVVEQVVRPVPLRDPRTGAVVTKPDPGDPHRTVAETHELRWLRFDPDLEATWAPTGGGFSVTVPGVLLSATTNTLRTDGIVVDAFLGGGVALDGYATSLQHATSAQKAAQANLAEAECARLRQGSAIVEGTDEKKAAVWHTVFPPTPEAPAARTGNGAGGTT